MDNIVMGRRKGKGEGKGKYGMEEGVVLNYTRMVRVDRGDCDRSGKG